MDPNLEDNTELFQRKAKRARRIAIICCFLLAFSWSVDAFFVWIFLGAAVYFEFLFWFYNFQARPEEPYRERQEKLFFPKSPQGTSGASKLRVVLPIVLAFVILVAITRIIFSAVSGQDAPDDKQQETSQDENVSANSNDVDLNALTDRGNEFHNQGNYDSALVYYNRVLTLDPGNQYAQYDKALVYYAKKDYYKPVPILLNCLLQHPQYGEACWLLGDTYFARNHLDSAKIWFDFAYRNGIRNGEFLQLLASIYRTDDKSKAIELYKESIKQDSSLADSYRKLIELEPARAEEYQQLMRKWSK